MSRVMFLIAACYLIFLKKKAFAKVLFDSFQDKFAHFMLSAHKEMWIIPAANNFFAGLILSKQMIPVQYIIVKFS